MCSRDKRTFRLLHFAREYWGKPLKFLTLTTSEGRPLKRHDLFLLLRHLRIVSHLEYLGVRTAEGAHGVYHLTLMSSYIDQAFIREKWESLTGAYRVNISKERSINALVREMTRQQETMRYSMSRNFVPKGTSALLDAIARNFRGNTRIWAYQMFARRCRINRKRDNCAQLSYDQTMTCVRQLAVGSCSNLKPRYEFNINEVCR